MKRIAVWACAVLGLALTAGPSQASWGHLCYSGYQPWWNIFAKRYKCLTPEEERLQKFWHDYYDALKCFYKAMDSIDWVAYYKNHGYQINGCGPHGGAGCGRINYAPVFVSPTLQWAVPAGHAGGPPVGPPYANHGMPMAPMHPNGPHGGHAMAGQPYPGMGGMPMAGMPMGGMPMGAMPMAGAPTGGAPTSGVPVSTGTPAGPGH
jgi:hypothetical protein